MSEHTPRRFQDNEQRFWLLDLNVAAIEDVRKETGVDLLDNIGKTYERIAGDIRLFCDVLYVLVRPQCDKLQITDEGFGRSLSGDVLDRASKVLLEAIIDFFPKHQRETLREIIDRMEALLGKTQETMRQRVRDPKIETAFQEELNRLGDSFSKSLESLASTPDPTHSEN